MKRLRSETATPLPIPARIWKIAAVTGAGAFMSMLDSTVTNFALESIRADFQTTLLNAQWVATGYLIALAVSLPGAGWLGNRFGYGRVWTAALAGFVVASACCAVSPNASTLIGARVIQGFAGGLMVPAGQAVIGSTAEPQQLGRLMGWLGLVISLGPAIGPAIGGLLLEVASWRWLFWMNVPIGLATLVLSRGLVPAGSTNEVRKLDLQGFFLMGIGLPLLLYGAAKIATGDGTSIPFIAVGLLFVGTFVAVSFQKTSPLIDMQLFRNLTFAKATGVAALTGLNMYGGLLLLPLFLQLVVELDQVDTGLMLLAMGLGVAFALPVAGCLVDRFGAGPVSLTGAALLLASTVPFLVVEQPSRTMIMSLLAIRGIGLAWAQMPAITAAYASVSSKQMGDASTLINIVQRIAGAAGAIAIVITIAESGGGAPNAYFRPFVLLTAASACTLFAANGLRRSGWDERKTPSSSLDEEGVR